MVSYLLRSFLLLTIISSPASGQLITSVSIDSKGRVEAMESEIGESVAFDSNIPLVSFVLNDMQYEISEAQPDDRGWNLGGLQMIFEPEQAGEKSLGRIVFSNTSEDTLTLENVVFLSVSEDRHHITGYGDHWLSRTRLFRPGTSDVPVILPDNAWEMGYSDLPLGEGKAIYGLSRRRSWSEATRRRFETIIYPGGEVIYEVRAEMYEGTWQEGLRAAFQKRWLFDLLEFDDTMYRREDLNWIQEAYVIHLMMAWDHWFYDEGVNRFTLPDFLARGRDWYGGDDIIGLWPTWPTLGLDNRNQWDHFRDLPGGIPRLRALVDDMHRQGVRFFMCYNPWDESTRLEDHLKGMAELIDELDADGVVLDTRGSSSSEIQRAADAVRPGVVMLSEGMAVPKDMPGIVSGRVHNALYYPPLLNLNKLIKPDFAIFRVAELTHERIRREYNISLFNGHGVEINMFRPGQPEWVEEDYRHLGRVARILRENSSNFRSDDFTPLVESADDSVFINFWPGEEKDLYTFFSLVPEGFSGSVMSLDIAENQHVIDLWRHEEVEVADGRVSLMMEAFHQSDLGTNNEGAVSAVAVLPLHLTAAIEGDQLVLGASTGDSIRIWRGVPSYGKSPIVVPAGVDKLPLRDVLSRHEGKVVVQLFAGAELVDERVLYIKPGTTYLISGWAKTPTVSRAPSGMVEIPKGSYKWITSHGDDFIGYPAQDTSAVHGMPSFYMDKYPVTNRMFLEFVEDSQYRPSDTTNFLAHWDKGRYREGQGDFPVVFVNYEDAVAYASWAGKRLPTEKEWQYAAQAGSNSLWPWGSDFDSTATNSGTGLPYAVGSFPRAANALGLEDLVGNVWQMTNDVYESGSYTYQILKGGSYYKPTSSWWYVQGGPQPLPHRQQLLMVSDGFNRKGTVGFRCLKDR